VVKAERNIDVKDDFPEIREFKVPNIRVNLEFVNCLRDFWKTAKRSP
jgi:hypothetical protein